MCYTSKEVYKHISQEIQDPIIERKKCEISGTEFPIYKSDLDFYDKISPTFNGKKHKIPTPKLCPEERTRRRMSYKNDRTLYKNTCSLDGNAIISTYSPKSNFKVYNIKDWRSDKRDPLSYGKKYNFSKSFFLQFNNLNNEVPKIAMVNDNGISSQNCEYCQNVAYSKNCYLTTVSWKLENSHYNSNMAGGKWLLDCFFTMDSEICYECTDNYNLFDCFWMQNSNNSNSCIFGYDLIGCSDCIACVGLRNKKYYIRNKQYEKDEYIKNKKIIQKDLLTNLNSFKIKFGKFLEKHTRKNSNIFNSQNSFGNNLVNAKNSIFCYNIKNLEDCKYSIFGDTLSNAYDLTVGGELNRCYEGIVPDHSNKAFFTIFCWSCSNIWYSEMCHSCQNCFGCVGLRNKQYCILNKQYSKQEYNKLVSKIIENMKESGERGEFFPTKYSPFKYNETIAQEYFPLTKDNVREYGTQWLYKKPEVNIPDGIKFVNPQKITKDPNNITNKILNQAIICEQSGRPFRIIEQELEFYRKHKIPLPSQHPDIRSLNRIKSMATKNLFLKQCDSCKIEILTPYKNNGNIYCEKCYNKIIY